MFFFIQRRDEFEDDFFGGGGGGGDGTRGEVRKLNNDSLESLALLLIAACCNKNE